jgi:hypothetical protein
VLLQLTLSADTSLGCDDGSCERRAIEDGTQVGFQVFTAGQGSRGKCRPGIRIVRDGEGSKRLRVLEDLDVAV